MQPERFRNSCEWDCTIAALCGQADRRFRLGEPCTFLVTSKDILNRSCGWYLLDGVGVVRITRHKSCGLCRFNSYSDSALPTPRSLTPRHFTKVQRETHYDSGGTGIRPQVRNSLPTDFVNTFIKLILIFR